MFQMTPEIVVTSDLAQSDHIKWLLLYSVKAVRTCELKFVAVVDNWSSEFFMELLQTVVHCN